MSVRDLIGKPWMVPCEPPDSFDCWELVRYVRSLYGLDTPSVVDRDDRLPQHRSYITTPPQGWQRLLTPQPLCVVRVGTKHVGTMLSGQDVIHCQAHSGVRIDYLHQLQDVTFWELQP